MKACEQASGYSVYQHGMDVANRYRDLYEHLQGGPACYAWSFKDDIFAKLQKLVTKAMFPTDARLYHIFHDAGKPDVLTIDEQGRRHFPGHADASAASFKTVVGNDLTHEDTLELIRLDMGFHTFKGEQLQELCKHRLAPTLLLTAWAELHANAEVLFGGFESDSFKIKRKALSKASITLSSCML